MLVAALGCGSIGYRHLQNLKRFGEVALLAFDPSAEARRGVESQLGIECVPTLDDVWTQRPTAVLISAPSNLHTELALAAAQRGCDLFIEKPVSHRLDGLDRVCAETDRHGLVTMVGCNMRFHPGPATVKRLIESGVVGEVIAMRLQTGSYLPRWRPGTDYRQSYSASAEWGGAALDCIHEVDLALWYGGPAAVAGAMGVSARSIGLATDGLIEILLRHESGALSNVHLNFIQRDYRRNCQIIGSSGTIVWEYNQQRVDVFGSDGDLSESFGEPDGWSLNQMYVDEIRHFVDAVHARRPTMGPITSGIAALQIVLAAKERGAASWA